MEKRVFLAIFLCFVVLAVYQAYFAPKPPTRRRPPRSATPSGAGGRRRHQPRRRRQLPPAAAAAPSQPAAKALVADTTARDIVVETDAVRAVFSIGRRGAEELAAQALQGRRRRSRSIWCRRTCRRISRGRSRSRPTIPRSPATLATALYRPSVDALALGSSPGTLSFEYRDASGLSARKTFHFQPEGKPYVLTVDAAVDVSGAAQPVTLAWGPALGLGFKPDGSREVPVRALQFRDGKVERLTPSATREAAALRGRAALRRRRGSVLPERRAARHAERAGRLPAGDAAGAERSEEPHAHFIAYSVASAGRRDACRSSSGRRTSTCCTPSTSSSSRAIDFGMFALARRAAPAGAEVDQRLRRQLRLVDRRPDDAHQHR